MHFQEHGQTVTSAVDCCAEKETETCNSQEKKGNTVKKKKKTILLHYDNGSNSGENANRCSLNVFFILFTTMIWHHAAITPYKGFT